MDDGLLEKLLSKKSKKTRVFSVRIPAKIYLIYELLDPDSEDIVELRQLVSAYIVAKAIEKGIKIPDEIKSEFRNIISKSTQNNNVVFNINISKSESKSEAKAEAKLDLTKLTELLNELEQLLLMIEKNNWEKKSNAYVLPPARMRELTEKIKELRRLVN
ncbi:hypothetical protein SSSV4_ORF159b [Sulfolobus spindle-shaped virus 4]|uniref:Uncharacterized protein n=2 Tax=Alphafusellovirus TaxID=10475 RepID=A8TKI2_9VIRU|nr:hypothetical protein SSSV4_ORF159b [Sulfolobus spindle-shaped virus 4]YP_002221483.1 hypothetical protein SSSV5_gp18 [Sulfolobus spindle-shaped virus 5]ABV26205.1 hypothetical protein [Sulfolobus spindle-shaped virus 4]ABV26239.1 hypothetical protein [Sulfolobus spindle-shaped virus 5]